MVDDESSRTSGCRARLRLRTGRFLRHRRPLVPTYRAARRRRRPAAIEWLPRQRPVRAVTGAAAGDAERRTDARFDLVIEPQRVHPPRCRAAGRLAEASCSGSTNPAGATMLVTVHGGAIGPGRCRTWPATVSRWTNRLPRAVRSRRRGVHAVTPIHRAPPTDGYHTTCHAPWYVLEHWSWLVQRGRVRALAVRTAKISSCCDVRRTRLATQLMTAQ